MLYLQMDSSGVAEYCTSGKFVCESGGAVHPRRMLNTFVLLLGSEGEYRIAQNGVEYVLTPGTYMLLLPGFEHYGTEPCPPKLAHYWCHFYLHGEYDLIGEENAIRYGNEVRAKAREERDSLYMPPKLLLPEFGTIPTTEKYRLLFHSLIDRSCSMNAYRLPICNCIVTQLLCELAEAHLAAQEPGLHSRQHSIAAKVVEYIHVNAASIRSVSEIAAHFRYNPEYLTTLVRKETSLSLVEHLNREKIEEAKKLLMVTNLTISEVSDLCGFSDPRYFGKLFHRYTDTTPSEYRNAYFKMHTNKNLPTEKDTP